MVLSRFPFIGHVLHRLRLIRDEHLVTWDSHVVRRDLTKPLPYADGVVDAVYSSHFLEHIYLAEAKQLLRESYRVLRPGGVVRLALPDGTQWARELVAAGDDATGEAGAEYVRRLGAHPEQRPVGLRRVAFLLGGHIHRWQPTVGLVKAMLREAGFSDPRECAYRSGNLPDLAQIETRKESFFIEAVR